MTDEYTAQRYRKKPVVIRAQRFDPRRHPWPEGVHPWPDDHGVQPRDMSFGYIETLEGRMSVQAGEWVITGVKGEIYPCKDDIFRMTYEAEEEGTP